MNLKPVVTSLFLMGLACGSVLAEGDEGGNGDIAAVEDAVNSADIDGTDDMVEAAVVRMSGKLNVDWAQRDFKNSAYYNYSPFLGHPSSGSQDYIDEHKGAEGHFGGNFQLNIDAAMGDNAAHLGLVYLMDDDNGQTICNGQNCATLANNAQDVLGKKTFESLSVQEAYVQMTNMAGTPFVLTWGHGYTDFGKSGVDGDDFSRLPQIKSGSQMLSQTRGNFLKLGLSDLGLKGFFLSGYMLDHKNVNDQGTLFDATAKRHEDRIVAYGMNAGYNFATKFLSEEQWGLNFGMVSNPGAAEIVELNTLNTAPNPAYAFSGHLRTSGFELDGSYVKYGRIYQDRVGSEPDRRTIESDTVIVDSVATATSTFFGTSVTKDDTPSAWDVRGAYTLADTFGPGASSKIFVGFGQTKQAVRLMLPESSYSVGVNQGLGSGASAKFTYTSQKNEDKKDANGVILKVNNKELKGSSNSIIAFRLSYEF